MTGINIRQLSPVGKSAAGMLPQPQHAKNQQHRHNSQLVSHTLTTDAPSEPCSTTPKAAPASQWNDPTLDLITPGLVDSYNRTACDLRLSVTDRCNLRCEYCLPEEHTNWIHRDNVLTLPDYARLIRIALRLGVTDVRITGGEPLLRRDLEAIISTVHDAFIERTMTPRIAMTTNAIGLDKRLDGLINAGLERINISLDSLDPARYAALAKRDRLASVMRTLAAIRDSQLWPVKLNTVIIDETSLKEIPQLITFALVNGFQWRAIEYMPIGPLARTAQWRPTSADIMSTIHQHFDIEPVATRASAPAQRWKVRESSDHPGGIIGVISSMTTPFCSSCDRTRVSADGKVYSCLFSLAFTDLKSALRSGASDLEIAELWKGAMFNKPAGHKILAPLPLSATMSHIGG
ncbi:MAG: GTP 3',8-cyclase MoaA [Actinomycetaceae bacterium]|nr:GTP 3',8-cyclase MoaA [Actinomycetaceae bacterium]